MKKDFVVKVEMKPIAQIIESHGVGKNGAVQLKVTNEINRRITRYMPYRASVLSTKSKYIKSPTMIEVDAPYAKYQYFGKAMVGPLKGPKVKTNRPLNYNKFYHPLAGPFWDRRLMQAEGKAIAGEVNNYIRRMK